MAAGLIMALVGLGACDKKTDPQPTRTELLTSKNWRLTAYSHTVNGGSSRYDDYASIQSCLKDDSYRFVADKSLIYYTGTNNCRAGEPQEYSGDWRFTTADESKLLFGLTNDVAYEYTIAELTDTRMVLTYDSQYNLPNGTTVNEAYRMTYSGQ
ncbi:hypothetical protein B0919_01565 [Hymenobacter sp. CRA2]|nr:hypothetical protein B0919_01565 [Hymenobacter sp. CRA2]